MLYLLRYSGTTTTYHRRSILDAMRQLGVASGRQELLTLARMDLSSYRCGVYSMLRLRRENRKRYLNKLAGRVLSLKGLFGHKGCGTK